MNISSQRIGFIAAFSGFFVIFIAVIWLVLRSPVPIAFDTSAQVLNIPASNEKAWTHSGCSDCSSMVVVVALTDVQGDHVAGVTYGGTAVMVGFTISMFYPMLRWAARQSMCL